MIKLKHILLEFVDTTISQLQKYLESSRQQKVDEIIELIGLKNFVPWLISEDENKTNYDISFLYDYTDEKEQILNAAKVDSLVQFKSKYSEFYDEMYLYIDREMEYNRLDSLLERFKIGHESFPSWFFLDAINIVKNQWLVHGTAEINIQTIKTDGFTKGVSDFKKLGLTTWFGNNSSIKSGEGYNFAYTIEDFQRFGYSQKHGLTYGEMVVVFRASGLRCYHFGDKEYQVIFNGKTATDIVPVFQEIGDGDWYIISADKNKDGTPKVLYSNENLVQVTKWLDQNYAQYRKAIAWEKPKTKIKRKPKSKS